jgi:hypothetical protein
MIKTGCKKQCLLILHKKNSLIREQSKTIKWNLIK